MVDNHGSNSNDAQTNYASLLFTDPQPQLLQCVACNKTLKISSFQCESGHNDCSSCKKRCSYFKNVLESVKIACQYRKLGCEVMMRFKDKNEHENACKYAPWPCILPGCNFMTSSENLHQHLSSEHSDSALDFYCEPFTVQFEPDATISVLLTRGLFFVIHRRKDPQGSAFWVSNVSSGTYVSYHYTATFIGCRSKLIMESTTAIIRGRISGDPPPEYLSVPSGFYGTCDNLELELFIEL